MSLLNVITPSKGFVSLLISVCACVHVFSFFGGVVVCMRVCARENALAHTQILAHILWHIYHQAQNSLSFNNALPLTLNNWTRCNTTSIARPRYSYTSHRAEGALTYSRDRINIQFPTSHYNSIKANLLLPLEHCFGWMLSGAPTPLWAQLRTFKHIKISQALHCPDYCLNIICFYILSLPLWLIFPLKLYPSVIIFFSL